MSVADTRIDIAALAADPARLAQLSDDDFTRVMAHITDLQAADRKENQLLYYQPASADCRKIHQCRAQYTLVCGGNGSSKTDSVLAHIVACCTGVTPLSVPEIREHFRGPIQCRVIVESLTTTLHPIILRKLKWFEWSGVSAPGGDKGHWGWIPKLSLVDGSWDASWSEKTRILRMLCRDPDNWARVLGESTIQFMSHDQDPSDMASGDFHIVMCDEPTSHAIWVENQARTMRVDGRMFLSMTWPDDPSIPVDWIFDELYEPGIPGPRKSPHHEVIELDTTRNRNLNQEAVQRQAANWDAATRNVRIKGQPIRFSNRVHPLFTDVDQFWSFAAGRVIAPEYDDLGRPVCPETRSLEVAQFNHVAEIEPSRLYPTVFVIDPHPRKPHMFMWVQIDGNDDYQVILDDELSGSPFEVYQRSQEIEEAYGLNVVMRLIDPNMALSPSNGQRREVSWIDEFSDAGLTCDLASDVDVGRSRINEYLQPDRYSQRPRLLVSSRCQRLIQQMKRYCWDDYKKKLDKDQKQTPKAKYDDYPTMLKYLMNAMPSYRDLMAPTQRVRLNGQRRSAY